MKLLKSGVIYASGVIFTYPTNTRGCYGFDKAIVRVRLRVAELFCVINEPVKQMLKIMLLMQELLSLELKELLLNF